MPTPIKRCRKLLSSVVALLLCAGSISCARSKPPQDFHALKSQYDKAYPVVRPDSNARTLGLINAQRRAEDFVVRAYDPQEREAVKGVLESLSRQLELQAQLPAESRITNGKIARQGQFPYEVALVFASAQNPYDGQYCAGSLVAPGWVLTAGHCVSPTLQPGDIKVLLGSVKLSSGGQLVDIAQTAPACRHPAYYVEGDHSVNDIALLRLADTTQETSIAPPNSDTEKQLVSYTRDATIMGWGDTSYGARAGSDNLLYGTVQLNSITACAKNQAFKPGEIKDGMICASGLLTDACQGDSGGPMVMRTKAGAEYVEGVVSWGRGCAQGSPGVYTQVPKYVEWIQKNLASNPDCEPAPTNQ